MNLNDYSNIETTNNIESSYTWKNICLIENDFLCVGGDNLKGFYLIKISTHELIKNIIGPKTIWCINKYLDGFFYVLFMMKKEIILLSNINMRNKI